jgi:hypothetical protein
MARNMKASWQMTFSAATKKKDTQKKTLLVYAQEKKTPQHKSTRLQSKTLKFNTNLNQTAKT